MIRAIIFDFGLVISMPRSPDRFRQYEKHLGIPPDSINRIMFDSPSWQDALVGKVSMRAFWYAIGPSLNLATHEQIDAFRGVYYGDERINEGVLDTLQRLHGRYRLAVLSNHPPGLGRWLEDWDIAGLFDVVYCSGDEGRLKPDPAVYLATLDRLKANPSEAIFIDDTLGHVAAAQSLGIHGIVFESAPQMEKDLASLLAEHRCPERVTRQG